MTRFASPRVAAADLANAANIPTGTRVGAVCFATVAMCLRLLPILGLAAIPVGIFGAAALLASVLYFARRSVRRVLDRPQPDGLTLQCSASAHLPALTKPRAKTSSGESIPVWVAGKLNIGVDGITWVPLKKYAKRGREQIAVRLRDVSTVETANVSLILGIRVDVIVINTVAGEQIAIKSNYYEPISNAFALAGIVPHAAT